MRFKLSSAAAMAALAVCFSCDGFAADRGRSRSVAAAGAVAQPRSASAIETRLGRVAYRDQRHGGAPAPDRDPYADPAAPYKADRLGWSRTGRRIVNIAGQTTVLTRQVLDGKNATNFKDALRTTAGVTVVEGKRPRGGGVPGILIVHRAGSRHQVSGR